MISILALAILSLTAAETDALQISANIRARHLPFGTILDPFLDSNSTVTGYTRCGDSAIWTGHYLAAEAYRLKVTGLADARLAVNAALAGIWELVGVTGTDVLARCYVPKDSPFAEGMLREEASNGRFEGSCQGRPCYWVGNTSRDQYIGIFFGLSTAYRLIEDQPTRDICSNLITRMLRKLLRDGWAIRMPNGDISTVFWTRADQQLSLLIIGRMVNGKEFSDDYSDLRFWHAGTSGIAVLTETLDARGSYFKFNLDVLTYLSLLKLEGSRFYRSFYNSTYNVLRRTIDDHGNAHFNMIDRAINGANKQRDAVTRELLEAWLKRPTRDAYVDWRGVYRSCGDEFTACEPIPVERRVPTDFLWQRSPFQLTGGLYGTIESPGIDYILPYWMARYYGVL